MSAYAGKIDRDKMMKTELIPELRDELLNELKKQFEANMHRHKGINWLDVESKIVANAKKLWSLSEMQSTGGEPDVVGFDKKTGEYIFFDCSPETPKGRRSISFDPDSVESRKEHKARHSALGMADEMGIKILSVDEYYALQKLGEFDLKTSSWVETPAAVRELGGALFCDRRFGRVFTYHNGAESYYAARGFRGSLRV